MHKILKRLFSLRRKASGEYHLALSKDKRKALVRVLITGIYADFDWATVEPLTAEDKSIALSILADLGVNSQDKTVISGEGLLSSEREIIG